MIQKKEAPRTKINRETILKRIMEKVNTNPERYHHYACIHHDLDSPRNIVPSVMELLAPKSVTDVGCGLGAWLKVFEEHGVQTVLGLDGDYVDQSKMLLRKDQFLACDLENPDTYPNKPKFDLAVCLEVAEHLAPKSAESFVKLLTSLSDAVLFSAAIPLQGGINHVNEQWPSYWQELFAAHGFKFYDLFRTKIWNKQDVKWWYKQNMFLVCKADKYDFEQNSPILNLVHPELFHHYRKADNNGRTK